MATKRFKPKTKLDERVLAWCNKQLAKQGKKEVKTFRECRFICNSPCVPCTAEIPEDKENWPNYVNEWIDTDASK